MEKRRSRGCIRSREEEEGEEQRKLNLLCRENLAAI